MRRCRIVSLFVLIALLLTSCQSIDTTAEPTPRATVIPSPTPEVTPEVRLITLEEYHDRRQNLHIRICYAEQNFAQDVAYSDLILEVTPNDYVIQEVDNPVNGKNKQISIYGDNNYNQTIILNFQIISALKGQYDGGDINIEVTDKQLSAYQKGSTYKIGRAHV